eukprot:gene1577-32962_t
MDIKGQQGHDEGQQGHGWKYVIYIKNMNKYQGRIVPKVQEKLELAESLQLKGFLVTNLFSFAEEAAKAVDKISYKLGRLDQLNYVLSEAEMDELDDIGLEELIEAFRQAGRDSGKECMQTKKTMDESLLLSNYVSVAEDEVDYNEQPAQSNVSAERAGQAVEPPALLAPDIAGGSVGTKAGGLLFIGGGGPQGIGAAGVGATGAAGLHGTGASGLLGLGTAGVESTGASGLIAPGAADSQGIVAAGLQGSGASCPISSGAVGLFAPGAAGPQGIVAASLRGTGAGGPVGTGVADVFANGAAGLGATTVAGLVGTTAACLGATTAAGLVGTTAAGLGATGASGLVATGAVGPQSIRAGGLPGTSASSLVATGAAGPIGDSATGVEGTVAAGPIGDDAAGVESTVAAGLQSTGAGGPVGDDAAGVGATGAAGIEGTIAAGLQGTESGGPVGNDAAGVGATGAAGLEGTGGGGLAASHLSGSLQATRGSGLDLASAQRPIKDVSRPGSSITPNRAVSSAQQQAKKSRLTAALGLSQKPMKGHKTLASSTIQKKAAPGVPNLRRGSPGLATASASAAPARMPTQGTKRAASPAIPTTNAMLSKRSPGLASVSASAAPSRMPTQGTKRAASPAIPMMDAPAPALKQDSSTVMTPFAGMQVIQPVLDRLEVVPLFWPQRSSFKFEIGGVQASAALQFYFPGRFPDTVDS